MQRLVPFLHFWNLQIFDRELVFQQKLLCVVLICTNMLDKRICYKSKQSFSCRKSCSQNSLLPIGRTVCIILRWKPNHTRTICAAQGRWIFIAFEMGAFRLTAEKWGSNFFLSVQTERLSANVIFPVRRQTHTTHSRVEIWVHTHGGAKATENNLEFFG